MSNTNMRDERFELRLRATDRQLLEGVAQLKGLRLSAWMRIAAIERSREELDKRLVQRAEASR